MWILLTVSNGILCIVCLGIVWSLRRKEQREVHACMRRIRLLPGNKADYYIWIHYTNEAFKELDALLSAIPLRVAVVFQAPAWLQTIKKRKWEGEGHFLIPADPDLIPCSFQRESRLVMVRGTRYDIFEDPVAFLKLYALPDYSSKRKEDRLAASRSPFWRTRRGSDLK
jgi:hypothetical protein